MSDCGCHDEYTCPEHAAQREAARKLFPGVTGKITTRRDGSARGVFKARRGGDLRGLVEALAKSKESK